MQRVLDDWRTAPIEAPLRAMLGFLEKLTLAPDSLTAADVQPLRGARLSDAAIEEAIHVCTIFNVYVRLADALGFEIPDDKSFATGARMLLKRGYGRGP